MSLIKNNASGLETNHGKSPILMCSQTLKLSALDISYFEANNVLIIMKNTLSNKILLMKRLLFG